MNSFSVQSWNVQGEVNITGHTLFSTIKPHLAAAQADIIALQELGDAEKLLASIPALEQYHRFIPKFNKRKYDSTNNYNHNVILSKYPILATSEITFLWKERRYLEPCSRVDIKIGNSVLRIYSCHFPIFRAGLATRLKQLKHVLLDASQHRGPAIICGDLNTTLPATGWRRTIVSLWHQQYRKSAIMNKVYVETDERELVNKTIGKYGFTETANLWTPTWSPLKTTLWEPFSLKLDWLMVKNLKVNKFTLGDYISDHRSIEAWVLII